MHSGPGPWPRPWSRCGAVRVSGRPADAEHSYGHGKIESLALFETLLLLGTCAWIQSGRRWGVCFSASLFTSTPTSGRFWSSSFLSSLTTPVRGLSRECQKAREPSPGGRRAALRHRHLVVAGRACRLTRRAGRTQAKHAFGWPRPTPSRRSAGGCRGLVSVNWDGRQSTTCWIPCPLNWPDA